MKLEKPARLETEQKNTGEVCGAAGVGRPPLSLADKKDRTPLVWLLSALLLFVLGT